jgi:hypothetical protein
LDVGVALVVDVVDDDPDLVDMPRQHDRRTAFTVYLREAVPGNVAADRGPACVYEETKPSLLRSPTSSS